MTRNDCVQGSLPRPRYMLLLLSHTQSLGPKLSAKEAGKYNCGVLLTEEERENRILGITEQSSYKCLRIGHLNSGDRWEVFLHWLLDSCGSEWLVCIGPFWLFVMGNPFLWKNCLVVSGKPPIGRRGSRHWAEVRHWQLAPMWALAQLCRPTSSNNSGRKRWFSMLCIHIGLSRSLWKFVLLAVILY